MCMRMATPQVKAAFLWELLCLGYDVLISDLDVVWLSARWEPWMTYRNPRRPPLPEAELQAMADVLVSTDELDEECAASPLPTIPWPHPSYHPLTDELDEE